MTSTDVLVVVTLMVTAAKDGVLRLGGFAVAGTGTSNSKCHQRTSRQKSKQRRRGISGDEHHGGDGGSITN